MLAHSYVIWWAAQILAVAILVFLLLRWRPGFLAGKTIGTTVTGMLDARAAQIQEQLQAAERSRQEAARIQKEAAEEAAQARTEAQAIVERARHTSEVIQRDMVERAREEKDRIVGQAREEIDYERRQAVLALQRRAADIAVDAARGIVTDHLQPETDRRIIEESLAKIRTIR